MTGCLRVSLVDFVPKYLSFSTTTTVPNLMWKTDGASDLSFPMWRWGIVLDRDTALTNRVTSTQECNTVFFQYLSQPILGAGTVIRVAFFDSVNSIWWNTRPVGKLTNAHMDEVSTRFQLQNEWSYPPYNHLLTIKIIPCVEI